MSKRSRRDGKKPDDQPSTTPSVLAGLQVAEAGPEVEVETLQDIVAADAESDDEVPEVDDLPPAPVAVTASVAPPTTLEPGAVPPAAAPIDPDDPVNPAGGKTLEIEDDEVGLKSIGGVKQPAREVKVSFLPDELLKLQGHVPNGDRQHVATLLRWAVAQYVGERVQAYALRGRDSVRPHAQRSMAQAGTVKVKVRVANLALAELRRLGADRYAPAGSVLSDSQVVRWAALKLLRYHPDEIRQRIFQMRPGRPGPGRSQLSL